MLNFLLFDDAKLHCFHRHIKKKHFASLAKQNPHASLPLYRNRSLLFWELPVLFPAIEFFS